jgi:hypothetical protein
MNESFSLPNIQTTNSNGVRKKNVFVDLSSPPPQTRHHLLDGSVHKRYHNNQQHHHHQTQSQQQLQSFQNSNLQHLPTSVKLNVNVASYSDDEDDHEDHSSSSLNVWNSIHSSANHDTSKESTTNPRPWSKGRDILRDGLVTHPIQSRRYSCEKENKHFSPTPSSSVSSTKLNKSFTSLHSPITKPSTSVWRPSGYTSKINESFILFKKVKKKKTIVVERKSLYQRAMMRSQHEVGIEEKERIQRKNSKKTTTMTPCSIQTINMMNVGSGSGGGGGVYKVEEAGSTVMAADTTTTINAAEAAEVSHQERIRGSSRHSNTTNREKASSTLLLSSSSYTSQPMRSVQVRVVSAGMHDGDYASIQIDNVEYCSNLRGMNVVVLCPETLQVKDCRNFNLLDDEHASKMLTSYISSIPFKHHVLCASRTDCTSQMTKSTISGKCKTIKFINFECFEC